MESFDVIVIGTGGGTKIIRPSAALGYRVAVIEKGRLGGTCLNHGCIPSKMFIHAADVADTVANAHRFDIDASVNRIHFEALVNRVNSAINAESDAIEPLYARTDNVTLVKGAARFISNTVVQVGALLFTAPKIVIATGARARIPEVFGLDTVPYLTYKTALQLTQPPKSLIIIGGGYIAVELGHYFSALGTAVTFVVRSGLVPGEDPDIRTEFERVFKDRHTVYDYTTVQAVEPVANGVCVTINQHGSTHQLVAAQLLVAAGIVPETDQLGLENTDVTCCPKGFIQTDDHAQTASDGVVALGDVRGQQFFRHTANFEGEYVFQRHVAGTESGPMRYPHVPHAIFTNPQVAGVGLSEPADASGLIIGINTYQDSAMGMALRSEHGLVKVLFDRTSLRLVGAHIIGPEAATMIHTCMAFLHMKATLSDMAGLMYIHPALPEVIRNAVRNAVQNKKQAVSA